MAAPSAPKHDSVTVNSAPPVAPEVSNQDLALAIMSLAEAIKTQSATPAAANTQLDGMLRLLEEREKSRPHENLFPPMKSDMNPEGERDFPRLELKCKMFWVGYKMQKDNLRRDEILLLNRLVPGEYRVTKGDGKTIPFTVAAKQDEAGKLERLSIAFPCKDVDARMSHLSMESYLRQVLGETASVESLMAQIQTLKAQLTAYQVAAPEA